MLREEIRRAKKRRNHEDGNRLLELATKKKIVYEVDAQNTKPFKNTFY